jgi:hypothetical protein
MVLAVAGCSNGYVLTDGAYGGNGGYGGTNPPSDSGSGGGGNDGGGNDGGFDAGFDGGFLSDGGCQPATSPTGCYPLGSPCYPSSGFFNSGCATGLVCYTYVNDAGMSQATCCQLMPDGTYLCM